MAPWASNRRAVIVAAGDLASESYGDDVVGRLMASLNFDAFLTLGDNAYGVGINLTAARVLVPDGQAATARRLIKAAEAGFTGPVNEARDYLLVSSMAAGAVR